MERSDRPVVATFYSADPFVRGGHVTLGDDAAQHARVLRVSQGENVELRDGSGAAARGVISRMAKRSLSVAVELVWEVQLPPSVHMLVPIADRDRMLLLAEKMTELAAASWRPVLWRRSKSVAGRGEGPTFVGRIRSRMISSMTQSGGAWLPQIHPSANVQRAIAAAPPGMRLLLDPQAPDAMMSLDLTFPLSIAVGPEGGLADDERQQMLAGGFVPVRIAPTVLRFETAGISALAIARATADVSSVGTAGELRSSDDGEWHNNPSARVTR